MNIGERHDRAAWVQGPPEKCAVVPHPEGSPWRLVLLGGPGVGKGTQAELLTARLTACHLSTGDVFRAAKNRSEDDHTPALVAALESMRRGALVPDEIVSDVVRERIDCLRCRGGFILDGFPRTLAQADLLKQLMKQEGLTLDAVLNYELPQAEIVSRLSGRRTCERCKAIFHLVTKPPKVDGTCDACGGKLYQREDDNPDSVKVRLKVYESSTAPLIQFYADLGVLVSISATGSPEEIYSRTIRALLARSPGRGVYQPS
jgi:adenylate kinase